MSLASIACVSLFSPCFGVWSGPQEQPLFQTAPERSAYRQTSTLAEVQAALEQLMGSPFAARLERRVLGFSAGRAAAGGAGPLPIEAIRVRSDSPSPLRVMIVANIHGGEVEGKEVCVQVLREMAEGQHGELFQALELLFVPIYNVDGNEAVGAWNRPEQNGPAGGVGERANGQGLDLNRDLIKAEAPETVALLGAFASFDPHLLLDLHTTNGTDHGYPLTYASSLVPGLDPDLAHFGQMRFLPAISASMLAQGLATFDYGNLEPLPVAESVGSEARAGQQPGGAPDLALKAGSTGSGSAESARSPAQLQAWRSFDCRPRFLTNYVGLRNRIALLSEAFSYADFELRISATRAFLLTALKQAAAERVAILRLCELADQRSSQLDVPLWLPLATRLERPWPKRLLLQRVEEFPVELPDGQRAVTRRATWELEALETWAQVRFEASERTNLPAGWAILAPPPELRAQLALHGVESEILAEPRTCAGERFLLSSSRAASRPFQGHRERQVEGRFEASLLELPVGSLLIARAQPAARLAAWLLEPQSLDSLTTWNRFDGTLEGAAPGSAHPVLRLLAWPE